MGSDAIDERLGEADGAVPSIVPDGAQAGEPGVAVRREFMLIGNRRRAHLRLESSSVSRCHAALIRGGNTLYVRDLGSRTGVLVNGSAMRESDLSDGDFLQVGEFLFRVENPSIASPAAERAGTMPAFLQGSAATFRIEGRGLLIGRRPTCDVTLDEPAVSAKHALVFELNGVHRVRDLYSRTGTWVNNVQVKMCQLRPGDVVRIGHSEFRYVSVQPPAPAPPLPALPVEAIRLEDDEETDARADSPTNEPEVATARG